MKLLHSSPILALVFAIWGVPSQVVAQGLVPGTGVLAVGDDFEMASWTFKYNLPKSSHEQDEKIRQPSGKSSNGRWAEGLLRGCPDRVEWVQTPPGGILGSNGAILISSCHSGVPGRLAGTSQQDDLIMVAKSKFGSNYPVSMSPSVVTHIYLPPFEEWEQRSGSMFAFRAEVVGTRRVAKTEGMGLFSRTISPEPENSWPGIFIQQTIASQSKKKVHECYFIIRGGQNGDVRGPDIRQAGWWTLGMSFTPDGKAHYYARPGVDDLEPGDHICSYFPYNFRVETLNTLFFDTFNKEDGKTWSTPVIVDNSGLYVNTGFQAATARARSMR